MNQRSLNHKSARQFAYHKILETPPSGREQEAAMSFPLILPECGDLGEMIEGWFKAQKATSQVHSYIQGNEAILAMVAAGIGGVIVTIHLPLL